jgi:hypothetical protein
LREIGNLLPHRGKLFFELADFLIALCRALRRR